MGSSSAILRRWISRNGAAGIFRSDANSNYSLCWRELASNWMMSTRGGGVSSSESASAPLVMLPPSDDGIGSGNRFYCLAKKEVLSRSPICSELKLVGSSHGWLALYNPQSHDLSLSDPTTDRLIKLPPVPVDTFVNSVILSSSDEREGKAFMSFGPRGRLAFCSPGRSNEWTLFDVGEKRVFDNLVYASRHNRLFCITVDEYKSVTFEGWDVGDHQSPRLEWMLDVDFDVVFPRYFSESDPQKLKYIVCAEHTGELFLVLRHVALRANLGGYWVDRTVFCEYRGPEFRTPYKTTKFDVYKIDRELGKLTLMESSLEGLAMFVGINHSLAIPAAEAPGLKPNSVYFSYDNRLRTPHRFGGEDNGIFDYQKRDFSPLSISSLFDYPVWFTPTPSL